MDLGDVPVTDINRARTHHLKPCDHAQTSGLARPGRSDQDDKFTALNGQIDRIDRRNFAEPFTESFQFHFRHDSTPK